jgi:hypothetical protein
MAKVKLGTKYECYSCGTKFYDFGKPHPICPSCGADQHNPDAVREPEVVRRSRNVDLEDSTFVDPDDDVVAAIDVEEDHFGGDIEEEEIEDLDE